MRSVGIMRVGFKPGSVEAIRQVVSIASRNPQSTVVVQWSGGRAGGHHSCEDQHHPILQTYGLLRDCSNILLVAGELRVLFIEATSELRAQLNWHIQAAVLVITPALCRTCRAIGVQLLVTLACLSMPLWWARE